MPGSDAPQTRAQLMEIEDPTVAEDTRPWGEVTESARTFWADGAADLQVVRSERHDGAFTLRAPGLVLPGLPVLESHDGEVFARDLVQRRAERGATVDREVLPAVEPYCPEGVPRGIHPKVAGSLGGRRFSVNSRGGRPCCRATTARSSTASRGPTCTRTATPTPPCASSTAATSRHPAGRGSARARRPATSSAGAP
ncbi:hypothetical protein ACFQV2_11630 [Actinokineospora soli]|uniref:Uncharacterized protein n=1 Tax=Actinokineospora soli TaxID=1048753 RepID=A0ABW2TKP5_9PSEU